MWPRDIFEGFASILEIQPDEVRPTRSAHKRRAPRARMTDREAIASDWAAVGSDLRAALERYKREH